MMLPRRGVIEIELLQRYGRTRVAPGTRAVGRFTLSRDDEDPYWHVYKLHIRIADDPKVVGGPCWFHWEPEWGERRTEAGLLKYALQTIIEAVELRQTPSKRQRFRVVRAAWRDDSRRDKRR